MLPFWPELVLRCPGVKVSNRSAGCFGPVMPRHIFELLLVLVSKIHEEKVPRHFRSIIFQAQARIKSSNHSWCRSPKETMVRCWTIHPGLSIAALLAFKFWKNPMMSSCLNLLISKKMLKASTKKNTVKFLAVGKSTNSNCLHCSTRHLRSNYGHKDTETPASLMSSWGT